MRYDASFSASSTLSFVIARGESQTRSRRSALSSALVIVRRVYAASGTARARASAEASVARIVRSACSCTRSRPRTRSGARPPSFLSRPNARSTLPRPRYRSPHRLLSRGIQRVQAGRFDPDGGGRAGQFELPVLRVERRAVLPQLGREAVAGIDARAAAERVAQRFVLTDQRDRSSPGRQGVDGLGETAPISIRAP